MSRKRKKHSRRRNPVRRRRHRNPSETDMLLLAGVVGVAGLGIWYLMAHNSTPALTPAQQGAAAAQAQDAAAAAAAQPTGSAAAT